MPRASLPGARPACSYVLDGDQVLALEYTGDASSWLVQSPSPTPLHRWLSDRGQAPIDARVPVLSYGSNACPSKLTTLRNSFGLPGPVIMTRCTVRGHHANRR